MFSSRFSVAKGGDFDRPFQTPLDWRLWRSTFARAAHDVIEIAHARQHAFELQPGWGEHEHCMLEQETVLGEGGLGGGKSG